MYHTFLRTLAIGMSIVLVATITPAVQATAPNQTGISTGASLLNLSDARMAAQLRDIRALGATWIRVDFSWSTIQRTGPDTYHWAPYDHLVAMATKHKLKVLATLDYTPPWARNPICARLKPAEEAGSKCAPRSTAEFARFATVAAQRYGSHTLHAWEIWNEPNLVGHWKSVRPDGKLGVDPVAYARIANAAARAIKGVDKRAFVITGSLAPVAEKKYAMGMRQGDYLKRLLPRLNKALFNAVSIHPYTWPRQPDVAVSYNAFYTVDHGRPDVNLRTIMGRAGWSNKQIWATEFGASTTGLTSPQEALETKKRPDHVTEKTQARIIHDGLIRWHKKTNVGPIFIHSTTDRLLINRKNEKGFGLRRTDNTQKPSYGAFREAAKKLKH